jgi:hypothetical protein
MKYGYYPNPRTEPTLTIKPGQINVSFTFQGDMFSYITGNGLYLSANVINPILSSFDFYSETKSLSTKFPPFTGYPIQEYEIFNNNVLKFNMPNTSLTGCNVDFIFCNEAGYAKASQSSRFSYVKILSD